MLRSPTLQRRTASALNSVVNRLRFRSMVEHSYRTCVRFLVSTETGEDQFNRCETRGTGTTACHYPKDRNVCCGPVAAMLSLLPRPLPTSTGVLVKPEVLRLTSDEPQEKRGADSDRERPLGRAVISRPAGQTVASSFLYAVARISISTSISRTSSRRFPGSAVRSYSRS